MDIYIVLKIFNYRKDNSTDVISIHRTYEGAKLSAHQKLIENGIRMGYDNSNYNDEDDEIKASRVYEFEKLDDTEIDSHIDWHNFPPDDCLYMGTYGDGYQKSVFVIVKGTLED